MQYNYCRYMKSIVIIFPYFGTLPVQYKMWRASAIQNPSINFMFFTDADVEPAENIIVHRLTIGYQNPTREYNYHFNETTQQGFATLLPTRISMLTFIHHTLPHQSTFFKRELFENSPYDESLKLVSDVKFYIQKICVEQYSVQLINDIICRREPDGISMAQNELRIKEHKQIIAEMLPPGAIQDYETLYLLDKSTMYKLMNLLENTNSRKWLIYCIKIINRLK